LITANSIVTENKFIQNNIFLLRVKAPLIAAEIKPSQFCNIKVSDTDFPLLRRPFSVCDVIGDEIIFMILIHGRGTEILSNKRVGDEISLIGPLGNGFNLEGDYDLAIFLAGGIGAAPFPFMNKLLHGKKEILTISGGRTKDLVVKYGMDNIIVATDDGSEGFRGNVIQLLESKLNELEKDRIKVFACGPTPMLKAISKFSIINDINCEISTESAMACGFGICMGCPVESTENEEEYKLICKHGPVFNAKEVKL